MQTPKRHEHPAFSYLLLKFLRINVQPRRRFTAKTAPDEIAITANSNIEASEVSGAGGFLFAELLSELLSELPPSVLSVDTVVLFSDPPFAGALDVYKRQAYN